MATMITSDCINCGACEPECPNNAIHQGDPVYVIDPQLCTECVGFHDYEACAAVCPVDVCVTDPNNIESEETLIARARALHPQTDFGENFQSRFRKGAANGAAGTATVSASEVAPAAPKAAASTPSAAPAPVTTPSAPAPAAKPAPVAAAPKQVPAKKPAPLKRTFPRELPIGFDEAMQKYGGSAGRMPGGVKVAVILLQPILGALPHKIKKRLEEAMQTPLFTVAGSTAVNIVHNFVIYPLVLMAVAAAIHGSGIIFSQAINRYVLIGLLIATVEGIYRLKDGILRAKAPSEMTFPASFYGAPLGILAEPLLKRYGGLVRDVPVPVEGFYSPGFVDKIERERRYGNAYTVEDRGGAFLVKMEFPRAMPDIGIAKRDQLPDELPDYDYDLELQDGQLTVKGKCSDEAVRKISSSVGAFPPEFVTTIPFQHKTTGFVHRYDDRSKLLEVLVEKA
jgi:NAD-dependent dihydropyrimidine dehydrogenase PreA subunit